MLWEDHDNSLLHRFQKSYINLGLSISKYFAQISLHHDYYQLWLRILLAAVSLEPLLPLVTWKVLVGVFDAFFVHFISPCQCDLYLRSSIWATSYPLFGVAPFLLYVVNFNIICCDICMSRAKIYPYISHKTYPITCPAFVGVKLLKLRDRLFSSLQNESF